MESSTDHIVFYYDLSTEQTDELRELLATDSAAAELLRTWHAVRAALRGDLETDLIDRELFALFVLNEAGRDLVLAPHERNRLEEAEPVYREALRRRKSLAAIAGNVRSEADAFEKMWDEWFGAVASRQDESGQRSHRNTRRSERPSRRRSRSGRWAVRAGIGVAVLVFAALLTLVGRRDMASVTVTTASGEVRVVELSDGSTVRMLGDSRLSYVPREDALPLDRQAVFEGEGFFDIAPDDRGYVVKTSNAQAVVLGTSFGVRTAHDETEVVLAEGRLALAPRGAPDRAVILAPGQMSRVEAEAGPSAPIDVRVHDRLAWTGLFVFHAAPLQDILDQLGRHYATDFTADDALLGEEVTGRFDQNQDPEDILEVLAAAVGAQLERENGAFRMSTP